MDEITLDGKTYISSKRAAAVTGYAKDYIGQLCREGRVEARLVGRSWYVYEPSLEVHKKDDGRKRTKDEESAEDGVAEIVAKTGENGEDKITQEEELATTPTEVKVSDISNIYNDISNITYISEAQEELPKIEEKIQKIEEEARLAEMQSAWQEWFSLKHTQEPEESVREEEAEAVPVPIKVEAEAEFEEQEQIFEPAPPENSEYRTVERPANSSNRMVDIAPRYVAEQPYEAPREAKREALKYSHQTQAQRSTKPAAQPSNTRVYKAFFIAIMVIAISISSIATGFIASLHLGGLTANALFSTIEGRSLIKN